MPAVSLLQSPALLATKLPPAVLSAGAQASAISSAPSLLSQAENYVASTLSPPPGLLGPNHGRTSLFADSDGSFQQQFHDLTFSKVNGQYQVSVQIDVPSDNGPVPITLTGPASLTLLPGGGVSLFFDATGNGPTRSDQTHHTYDLSGTLTFPPPSAPAPTGPALHNQPGALARPLVPPLPPLSFQGRYSDSDPHNPFGAFTASVHGKLGVQ
jgi:hypothetical protein